MIVLSFRREDASLSLVLLSTGGNGSTPGNQCDQSEITSKFDPRQLRKTRACMRKHARLVKSHRNRLHGMLHIDTSAPVPRLLPLARRGDLLCNSLHGSRTSRGPSFVLVLPWLSAAVFTDDASQMGPCVPHSAAPQNATLLRAGRLLRMENTGNRRRKVRHAHPSSILARTANVVVDHCLKSVNRCRMYLTNLK